MKSRFALLPLLVLLLAPVSIGAAPESSTLSGKEVLKLEGLKKARRNRPAGLAVRDESFELFRDPGVRGAIDPTARPRDRWQLDLEGLQALEEHIANWVRADGTELPEGSMDEATAHIESLSVRGRRNRKGTRASVVFTARVRIAGPEGASWEGVYKFKGRGRLAPTPAPEGELVEGFVPGPSGAVYGAYRVRDGMAIVEGDIAFPLPELEAFQARVQSGLVLLEEGGDEVPYAATIEPAKRWPDGRVPYVIAAGFSDSQLRDIRSAIRHWNQETDVAVVERTNESTWAEFTPVPKGCSSPVGYVKNAGARMINLETGCGRGSIVHEIGHMVGLWHEQSRSDRDTYVTVDIDNVEEGKEHNFDKKGDLFGPYNFGSIMHYSKYAFADDSSKPTISPRRDLPVSERIVGQRRGLSKGDIAAANYLVTGDLHILYNAYNDRFIQGFATSAHAHGFGDVNGDDSADVVAFAPNGDVHVATSRRRDRFADRGLWIPGFCPSGSHCLVGDVNGDGLADVVEVETGRIALSDGQRFVLSRTAESPRIGGFDEYRLVDVNGDCKADIVAMVGGGQQLVETYVALSEGRTFANKLWWGDFPGTWYDVGDVDADGRADFVTSYGFEMYVHRSEGDGFGEGEAWWTSASWFPVDFRIADINGDARGDVVSQSPASPEHSARIMIALSNGRAFRGDVPNYHEFDCMNMLGCDVADADGDGNADVVDAVTLQTLIGGVRDLGDVYVSSSRVGHFATDPIGPLEPAPASLCFAPALGPVGIPDLVENF